MFNFIHKSKELKKLKKADNIAKYKSFQYRSKYTKTSKVPNYWFTC